MARSKVPNGNFPSPYQKKTHRNQTFFTVRSQSSPTTFHIFSQMSKLCFFLVQMSLSKKLITVWIQAKLAQGRLWRSRNLCCISTWWRERNDPRNPRRGGWKNIPFFICFFTEISFRSLFSWKSYLLPSLHLKIPF